MEPAACMVARRENWHRELGLSSQNVLRISGVEQSPAGLYSQNVLVVKNELLAYSLYVHSLILCSESALADPGCSYGGRG